MTAEIYDAQKGSRVHEPVRPPRGRGFDAEIMKLATKINEIQDAGHRGVQEIADELNRLNVLAPSGGRFSFGTTYRVLKRGGELDLWLGPLNLPQVKKRLKQKKAALVARVMQKHSTY